MDKNDFERVQTKFDPLISLLEMDKQDRTLLYGYDTDRNTYHVYAQNDCICIIIYKLDKIISFKKGIRFTLDKIIPSNLKRLYPAKCDYEFCSHLRRCTLLPFTKYEETEKKTFYGKIKEDFDGY